MNPVEPAINPESTADTLFMSLSAFKSLLHALLAMHLLAGCASLPPGVVSRETLFDERQVFRPIVSPDGLQIAYIRRGMTSFFWHPDSKHLLYWQDNEGDERAHDLSRRIQMRHC